MSDRGDGRVYQRKGSSRWWIQYNVRGEQVRESAGKTEAAGRSKLKARLREAMSERFVGPAVERVKVVDLLDALVVHLKQQGKRSVDKLAYHLKPLRAFFGSYRAIEVTSKAIALYTGDRLDTGRAPATINRELEGLRQAFNHAARQTPPLFPRHVVPGIPMLPTDNVRQGFFEAAEIAALLKAVHADDLRDFIEWGFRTGQRKGELARLTWEMLDRSGSTWTLRIPGSITKNKQPRVLALEGGVRTIMERRVKARRLDCPLIFHRVLNGKPGRPIGDIRIMWRQALKDAALPAGRLFHDLRRSAVRNLIRAGVDPSVAMKVSGHKTRSMLDRYNIIAEQETAAAFKAADAYLSLQPTERNVTPMAAAVGAGGENRASTGTVHQAAVGNVLSHLGQLAEAGGNRTHRSGV